MVRQKGIFYRLTRAFCLWALIPALLLLALRPYWQVRADQRFAAVLASLKAGHLHTTAADFPDDSLIPPTENAPIILFTGPVRWTSAENALLQSALSGRATAADALALQKTLDAHPDLLPRIDAAAAAPHTVWPRAMFTDPTWSSARSAAGWGGVGRLLGGAAFIAHAQHDDALALTYLKRLHAAVQIFEKSPSLLHNLLALSFRGTLATAVSSLAPEFDLRSPALQAQAQTLAADLAADNETLAMFATSWQGEITFRLPVYLEGKFERDVPWPLRPLYRDTLTRRLQFDSEAVEAFRAANLQEFLRRFQRIPKLAPTDGNLEVILHEHEGLVSTSGLRNFFTGAATQLAASRAASLLLAARIYSARHGNLPPSANLLVPSILPALPIDPCAEPQRPLSYRLSTPTYPFVWSVGLDNRDDHGSTSDLLFPVPLSPPAASLPASRPTTRAASRPASR